jgi:hypothetical protein
MGGAVFKFDGPVTHLPDDQVALVGRKVYRLEIDSLDNEPDDKGYYVFTVGRLFKSTIGTIEVLGIIYDDSINETQNQVEFVRTVNLDSGVIDSGATPYPWKLEPSKAVEWAVSELRQKHAEELSDLNTRLAALINKAVDGGQS